MVEQPVEQDEDGDQGGDPIHVVQHVNGVHDTHDPDDSEQVVGPTVLEERDAIARDDQQNTTGHLGEEF